MTGNTDKFRYPEQSSDPRSRSHCFMCALHRVVTAIHVKHLYHNFTEINKNRPTLKTSWSMSWLSSDEVSDSVESSKVLCMILREKLSILDHYISTDAITEFYNVYLLEDIS
jgi:predicted methyltransferase